MGSPSTGPVEALIPGRRRASSAHSTGFDYSTSYRVEEDILSRIRALVLSRNKTRPPRTPNPSDERNPPQHEPRVFGSFDCITTKSNPRGTQSESRLLDTDQQARQLETRDGSMEVDGSKSRRPTDPDVLVKKPPTKLRSSSSTNDLGLTFIVPSDATIDSALRSPSPPDKKRFRLPRLVLRDIKDPDEPSSSRITVQSCLPGTNKYKRIPANDTSAQDDEQSCPHCEQSKKQFPAPPPANTSANPEISRFNTLPQSPPQEAKRIPDIACSPHCPPSCKDHYVFHPLPAQVLAQKEKLMSDIRTVEEDITNLDHAINDINDGKLVEEAHKRPKSTHPSEKVSSKADPTRPKSECSFRTATKTNTRDTDGSPPPSRGSSVSSVDTFPHVLTSEMVAKELIPRPLSSAVVTNFSLPGPKAHVSSLARDDVRSKAGRSPSSGSIRPKQSDTSLKSNKPHTPSLLSGASRTSVRHSLLKPSVSANNPVDTGLPIPPVVSPVSPIAEVSAGITSPSSKTPLQPVLATIAAAAADLSAFDPSDDDAVAGKTSPEAREHFVVEEISPTSIKLGYVDKSRLSAPLLTAVVTIPDKSKGASKEPDSKPSIPMRHEAHTLEGCARRRSEKQLSEQKSVEEIEREDFPPRVEESSPETFPSVDPLNASYWGFAPAVKDAVHDAVQVAVRNAVQDIVVPPGTENDEASDAYRLLVADSLAEAAKSADSYLRRSSLWNQPPTSARESYFEAIPQDDEEAHIATIDFSPNQEGNSSQFNDTIMKTVELDNSEKMEEVPLNPSRENRKQASAAKGPPMNAIPDRHSSKNQVPKEETSSAVFSLKERGSRRGSKDGLLSRADKPRVQQQSVRSGAKGTSDDKMSRRNTVHWLRELLTSNDAYAPRLTALPPRSRREDRSGSSGRMRSQTAPAQPVEELFLGATPSPLEMKPKVAENNPGENRTAVAETFTRTINDLEKLLNEALFIARQAADKDDPSYVPALLGNAAAILKGGRKNLGKEGYSVPLAMRKKKHVEKRSSVESIHSAHESARSFSGTSTEGNSDDDEYSAEENMVQIDITSPSGIEKKPGKIDTNVADCMLTFAKGRDRSTTWDSARALHAMAIRPQTSPEKSHPKRLSIPKGPDLYATEPSPMSDPIQTELSPTLRNPEGPSRAATSGFNWQDISQSQTTLQSPTVQQSQRTLTGRMGEQPSGRRLYEEDATALSKLPVTELRSKTSVSNSLDGSHPSETVDFQTGFHHEYIMQHVEGKDVNVRSRTQTGDQNNSRRRTELRDEPNENVVTNRGGSMNRNMNMGHHLFNLNGKRHVSLRDHKGFSLARTHKRRPIARDWSPSRKRFTATVSCVSTALVGAVIGIYAGEVPAIQYLIVDLHHFAVLGNVFFFLGLAIPTAFFWPLPLLHGRKPYILGSMSIAMPLLFPQALAVGMTRNPNLPGWRIGLLFSRALMGFALGFANMNFLATLMDLFGASLQSSNPHQEYVDESDVRRHGGGMGLWLGIWTWCYIGSIGIGFMLGAIIINFLSPAWGFYISIAILALVLLLNVVAPEVRRSAFRRSVAEVRTDDSVSRRLAKGEVKMHRVQTGPKWWGEEFHHGLLLSHSMMRQPGFLVLAFYVAWIYGQVILIIILLGSLTSKYYQFKSPFVGASVASVPLGALLSVPFQKAGIFSRERKEGMETDDDTLKRKKISLSSHFVRRSIFVLCLPFMGLAYTLSSQGPPTPFILPIIWAGAIGFLSNLAVAECNGIIMETFDTSDLQPGMTGRPRNGKGKVTNYSCFPRVCAAFGITQGMGFCMAALASGIGGVAQRHLGQQAATGVMCGILLILSILLICILARFQDVQIIPESKTGEMEQWQAAKRAQYINGGDTAAEEWRPTIIGNPTHIMRRMSVLEMGSMTRWSDIRTKNRLVDAASLEARHPNLNTLGQVEHKLKEKRKHAVNRIRRSLSNSRDGSFDTDGKEDELNRASVAYSGRAGGGRRNDDRYDNGEEEGMMERRRESGRERYREMEREPSRVQSDLGGHREMDLGTLPVPVGRASRESRKMSRISTRSGVDRVDRATERGNSRLRRGTVVSRGIEERDD